MVTHDGLTDDQVPMNRRCGPAATVVKRLTGEVKPGLAEIRNNLAHGYQFDGLPLSGLLELVRDLIEYAYRDIPVGNADFADFFSHRTYASESPSGFNGSGPVRQF